MSKPDNPKAFPYGKDTYMTFGGDWQGHPGMTLRDYFAGQALVGILGADMRTLAGLLGNMRTTSFSVAAYDLADAMLEARKIGGDA